MLLYFLEYLACKYNDRRSAVAYFGVLGARYVGQYTGSGMDNVEELTISTYKLARKGEIVNILS